jgi:membrane protease YdiL (CAAX protease family)
MNEPLPSDRFRPALILGCSTVLMLAWWHLGSREFYLERIAARLPFFDDLPTAAACYSFAAGLLLLGVVPAAIVKLVFRQSLADYGVQLGNRLRTVRSFLILAPGCLLAAYLSSRSPAMRAVYPLSPNAADSPAMFTLHACSYLMFYLGWEFHFRGFLQFGLRESLGRTNALLVQVMASSLLHLGRPGLEVFAAVAGGLLWGVIAYRSRSLLSGFLQHFLLGITLDWSICYL